MRKQFGLIFILCLFAVGFAYAFHPQVKLSPNGITIPANYKNWRILAPSYRSDNKTIRVILGNSVAIQASRSGTVVPWPEGSILAKIVWKDLSHDKWPSAVIPGKFVHVEFMIKDSKKYSSTGGWGFARWKGLELQPYGDDADFVNECFGCHTPVKDNDYVFTRPAEMP